ncbi:MAG: beta-galactosidase [Devosia sp.]|nr:beta-galactosidase [Devosia sp.]
MTEAGAYLYGTQYFRPPNPPRHEHAFHLRKIKHELGFDIVRLRIQWNAIHRTPGRFDWSEYDEIADICEEIGLGFLIETNLESAPYWLERAHPEARYVSANGQAIELGPYDSTQLGGYPGLCFHHHPVEEHGRAFLSALVGHFRDRKGLVGYDCWNEPHLEPAWICNYWGNTGDRLFCYCGETRRAFRGWLAAKYGDVEVLNATWGRAYGEWDDISPPNRHGTYADWLDWGRFWFDWLQDHMQWRYDTIKAADASRFVMSHSGAVPPFLPRANAFIHNWKLAAPVDMWGTSFAPKYHNWSLSECAGTMDATRSAARGKPFWISEMSGGSTYIRAFNKTPLTRPKDYRAWNWLAAAYGAYDTLDDLDGLKILFVPMCLTLPEAVTERIAAFVRGGGVLVAEARTGLFDERGYNRPNLPAGRLAEVVGAIELEALCSDPDNRPPLNNPTGEGWPDPIYNGPPIEITDPLAATLRAHGYLVPLKVTTGTPIADCLGHCVGVKHGYGRGTAYYFGTYLGLAQSKGVAREANLIAALIRRHAPPPVFGTALRPRLMTSDAGTLLAVFNDDRHQRHAEAIALPDGVGSAVDVQTGELMPVEAGTIRFDVDAEDVCVVRLR